MNPYLTPIISCLIVLCLSGPAFADPAGSPDKTFNKTGIVKDSLPQLHETVKDVAVQSDGRIIVVGTSSSGNGSDAFLARYTSDGKLDSSFNGKGYVVKDYDFIDYLTTVKLQRNGKIVAAGSLYGSEDPQARLIVCRYNSNGTLDTSFNGKGYIIFSEHTEDTAFGVEIDASGRIITAGSAIINDQFHILICRFSSNGTLDTSFAGNGYYVSETTNDSAYALALQHDGKIIAAGAAYSDKEKSWVLALFAFLQNGKPDTSFNKSGRLLIPTAESSFYSLAVQPNGNIIGGGYATFVDEENYIYQLDPIIFQINKNGVLDSNFNVKWAINLSFINMEYNNMVVTDVAVAPDGKIVFCGYQYGLDESSYDIFVCRYTSDGNLDYSFGQGGYILCDFGNTFEIDAHVAVTANGSIIVAGNTSKEYRQYYNEDLFLLKLRP
jgi:uncharacterized delta-60 repeat protein